MGKRYAEGTTVSVDQSRGEISGILAKHGVQVMAWGTRPEGDTLQFDLAGHAFRFTIPRPTVDEIRERDSADYVYPHNTDWSAKTAQEWRRRWRAHVLLLKAKLEFAEGDGPSTIVRELMPYMLVAGNKTLEQVIESGGVKLIEAGR